MSDNALTRWAELTEEGRRRFQKRDFAGAEDAFRRALSTAERIGEDSPQLIQTLNNLGALLVTRGDAEHARPHLERALAASERKMGKNHPALATVLTNLARLHVRLNNAEEAEPLLQRLLGIREKEQADSAEVATALASLAKVTMAQHKFGAAEGMWLKSYKIREKLLPAGDPGIAAALEGLAEASEGMGLLDKAREYRDRLQQMRGGAPAEPPRAKSRIAGVSGVVQELDSVDTAQNQLIDSAFEGASDGGGGLEVTHSTDPEDQPDVPPLPALAPPMPGLRSPQPSGSSPAVPSIPTAPPLTSTSHLSSNAIFGGTSPPPITDEGPPLPPRSKATEGLPLLDTRIPSGPAPPAGALPPALNRPPEPLTPTDDIFVSSGAGPRVATPHAAPPYSAPGSRVRTPGTPPGRPPSGAQSKGDRRPLSRAARAARGGKSRLPRLAAIAAIIVLVAAAAWWAWPRYGGAVMGALGRLASSVRELPSRGGGAPSGGAGEGSQRPQTGTLSGGGAGAGGGGGGGGGGTQATPAPTGATLSGGGATLSGGTPRPPQRAEDSGEGESRPRSEVSAGRAAVQPTRTPAEPAPRRPATRPDTVSILPQIELPAIEPLQLPDTTRAPAQGEGQSP